MKFNGLVTTALAKAGKQETLATALEMSASSLSKRLNGETGWSDSDIDKLIDYTGLEICKSDEYKKKITTLKEAMKLLLNGDDEETK